MANFHVITDAAGHVDTPEVRRIGTADVWDALNKGFNDFWAQPSHYIFLSLIFPLVGVVLAAWSAGGGGLHLIFPLMSGFALIGPLAALGLYEISRRREIHADTSWLHALEVRHSPAIPAILAVGGFLLALFVIWLFVASAIFRATFGDIGDMPITQFVSEVLTTERGWTLIVIGNIVGAVFAVVALATTVVAFPLLLDRDVGAVAAVKTSLNATTTNPGPVALWGVIVAALLVIGSIPLFTGLAVVMPILGHATWHLYRKLVVQPPRR